MDVLCNNYLSFVVLVQDVFILGILLVEGNIFTDYNIVPYWSSHIKSSLTCLLQYIHKIRGIHHIALLTQCPLRIIERFC